MSGDQQRMVLTIKPQPSLEELAAITAAVTSALRSLHPVETLKEPDPSRWARQGRLEAMSGLERDDDRL